MDSGDKPHQFALRARDGSSSASAGPRPSVDVPVQKPRFQARILVVEDQEDVRRMVATALEIEGYRADEAADANEGLSKLAQCHYHLVLSDYAMPGGTGTWMLQQAAKRGLMDRTVALMVTAHPDVRELADVAVISKPLDLDYFLEQVRKLLVSSGVEPARTTPVPPHKVEFVLYISSTSPASIQARQNLAQQLEGFDASQVKFTIVDLLKDPLAGEYDRVAFTPTLVKRYPGPRTWILGNLRHRHMLSDLLKAAGIDEVR
jgi:DNA-binding response OmpR family regulator